MDRHHRSSRASLETSTPRRTSATPPPTTQTPREARWRRITRKILVGIAIGVASLWLLWVVVANVALETRIVRDAFDTFPKRTIDWSSAWTLWPGVFHVRDAHLRVRNFDSEILLVVDEGWIDVDLFALAKKKLVVRDAEVHGVSLRFRKRLDPREPLPKTYALPPIEGFEPIPWMNLAEWEPPKDDAHFDLLTIDVRHVTGDVREVWIQDYRFTGDARAWGGFYLRPGKELEIGPAHFESSWGVVRVGPDVAMEGGGSIDAHMPRFPLTLWSSDEMVNAMKRVDVKLDVRIPSWAFLEHRHLGDAPPHLLGGTATLHLDGHVRDAELWTGTKLTIDVHDLTVEAPKKATVKSSATFTAEVKGPDDARVMIFDAVVRDVDVRLDGAARFPMHVPTLAVLVKAKNLPLRKPFNDARVSVDSRDVQLTDLRIFQQILSPDGKATIGEGAAIGSLHLDTVPVSGFGDARATLSTHTASVRIGDAVIAGSVEVDAKAAWVNLSTFDADLSKSAIDLRDVRYAKGSERGAPWWGRIDFDRAIVHPKSKTTKASFTSTIRMRDVRPILATYASMNDMPKWLREMLAMEDFHGTATARIGDSIDLDDFRATSTDAAVGARVHVTKEHKNGAIFVDWKGLSLGIELHDGSTKPILEDPRGWFEAQR